MDHPEAIEAQRRTNRKKNIVACLLMLPFLGCCFQGVIWPAYKPDWVRSRIEPGMSLREVLEGNRRHLGCDLTIADVKSSGIVVVKGHLWPNGGRFQLRSTAPQLEQLRFAQALDRIEAEIAAITTSSGYTTTLMYSPRVDVYLNVTFQLDAAGRVQSVER